MIILKEKFQLISYIENKHFNLEGIAKELYGKITKKMKILILQKFLLNQEMIIQQKEDLYLIKNYLLQDKKNLEDQIFMLKHI